MITFSVVLEIVIINNAIIKPTFVIFTFKLLNLPTSLIQNLVISLQKFNASIFNINTVNFKIVSTVLRSNDNPYNNLLIKYMAITMIVAKFIMLITNPRTLYFLSVLITSLTQLNLGSKSIESYACFNTDITIKKIIMQSLFSPQLTVKIIGYNYFFSNRNQAKISDTNLAMSINCSKIIIIHIFLVRILQNLQIVRVEKIVYSGSKSS